MQSQLGTRTDPPVPSDPWKGKAPSPFLIRAADAMADAIIDMVNRGLLDSRSRAADAVLSYCGIRVDTMSGDEINKYLDMKAAQEQPR